MIRAHIPAITTSIVVTDERIAVEPNGAVSPMRPRAKNAAPATD
jgi:hypothetical protein